MKTTMTMKMSDSWFRMCCVLLVWTLSAPILAAGPPERVNFQGVLRDTNGGPVGGNVDMVFRFYDVLSADTVPQTLFLTDQHRAAGSGAVTVVGGLFNVVLGSGVVVPNEESALGEMFGNRDEVYVEIEVNGETLLPRIRMESSAYAQNALRLEGKRAAEYLDTSSTTQIKQGDLQVQGDVVVGGDVSFADGSVLNSGRRADPPCFDAADRYVDCGNGTVTDTVTGLIWLTDANCDDTREWTLANEWALALGDGQCGLSDGSSPGDWRLPTREEWQEVVDQATANGCGAPYVPDAGGSGCCGTGACAFSGVQSGIYWSSVTDASSPPYAWVAFLVNGDVFTDFKGYVNWVWPVRGEP